MSKKFCVVGSSERTMWLCCAYSKSGRAMFECVSIRVYFLWSNPQDRSRRQPWDRLDEWRECRVSIPWIDSFSPLTMECEHFQSCLITSSRRRIFKNSVFNCARGFHYWKLCSDSTRRNYFCSLTATFHEGPTVAVTSPTHHCLVFRSRPHEAVSFLFYHFEWWFQAFAERF